MHLRSVIALLAVANTATVLSNVIRLDAKDVSRLEATAVVESAAGVESVDHLLGRRQVFSRDDAKNNGKDEGGDDGDDDGDDKGEDKGKDKGDDKGKDKGDDKKEKKKKKFKCISDDDCATNEDSPLFKFKNVKCDKSDKKNILCVVLCKKDEDCVKWSQNLKEPVKMCPAEYPVSDEVREEIGSECAFCSPGPYYKGQCVRAPT